MTDNPSQPTPSDHRPYIETVRVALLLRDIRVGAASFNPGRVRSAAMTLPAPDEEFDEPWHRTFTSAQFVELRWNEEDGWSLLALHPAEAALLPTIWHHGFTVVPPPEKVCTWLALLLTMPGISGSGDDGRYCTHQHSDPAFEASLAAYAL